VATLAVTAAIVAVRVAWVFPLHAIIQWRRGTRPAWPVPTVVAWAGTRGVVPLAAALSIPLVTASGQPLPQRDLVIVVATTVIAVTLVVQGFTLEPLARFAGVGERGGGGRQHEETIARLRLAEAALARLDELASGDAAPDEIVDRLRAGLESRIGQTRAKIEPAPDEGQGALTERELRGDLIAAENAELARLFADGTISAATRQRLQQALDLEATRLDGGHR
jgi:CPA1 family monovalent cation:H+ antiporter